MKSLQTNGSLKWLRIAALFAFVFHALGLVVALFGIRFGTSVFPTEQRMAYVATSVWGWKAAWGVWFIAALTFVGFLAMIEKVWDATGVCARLSLIVGVAAASFDSLFDTLQIVVLPAVAERAPESNTFLMLAHFASAGGIILANGLYAIAVALMTCALSARLSPIQRTSGWLVLVFGLLLTATGFTADPHLAELFAGPAIGTYMLWIVVMAWRPPAEKP
jgi:hypothetical protein